MEVQGGREAGEQESVEGLKIWPNPASAVLSVKVFGLSSGIGCSLVIYDIFGRIAPTPALPQIGGGRVASGRFCLAPWNLPCRCAG